VTSSSASSAPLVSVVLNTYNRADLVPQSINSVLAQDYPNFEVIVVDDGSTDNTREVIEEQFGDRVRYIYQENAGLAAGRNTGIKAARGQYIAFQDDDDIWLPGKLTRQIDALGGCPDCGLSYGLCLSADSDGNSTGAVYGHSDEGRTGDNFELMLRRHPILGPSVVVLRAALDEAGLFDETLSTAEDTDLFLRLTQRYPAIYIARPLVLVREHRGRKTRSEWQDTTMANAHVRVHRKLLVDLSPEREGLRPVIEQTLGRWAIQAAGAECGGCGLREFVACISDSCRGEYGVFDHLRFHKDLAKAMSRAGLLAETGAMRDLQWAVECMAEAGRPEARTVRRRRALYWSALARSALRAGRVRLGGKCAVQAIGADAVTFCASSLPGLPRPLRLAGRALRRLARRADRTAMRGGMAGYEAVVEGRLPNDE